MNCQLRKNKSETFDIDKLFLDRTSPLKRRLDQQKASCDTIFVDDCCKVRSKLQQIFPNVLVKLDLFHAIQSHLKSAQEQTAVLVLVFHK